MTIILSSRELEEVCAGKKCYRLSRERVVGYTNARSDRDRQRSGELLRILDSHLCFKITSEKMTCRYITGSAGELNCTPIRILRTPR